MFAPLYGKSKSGKVKEWKVWTEGNQVVISHGYIDGKKSLKVTTCEPKNVGRSNETTGEEQAFSEAKSRWNKQVDKCYRESVEECLTVGELLPMLAHDYTKVGHRMVYPCYISAKLDGVRCLANVTLAGVTLTSRGGKKYPVPEHIKRGLIDLIVRLGVNEITLDGELYIHGMQLQDIVSCVKKPNKNTPLLKFYIFDVPSDKPWNLRNMDLELWIGAHVLDGFMPGLEIVVNEIVDNEAQARDLLMSYMEAGYEGIMLRSFEGLYEFNHRSSGLMKWKEFQDIEAYVLDVAEDRLGEGVLHVKLQSGVEFDCKMRGTHEERLVTEQAKLIGKWITVRFQQYTKDEVPQFPVGVCVRDCDKDGNPIE